MRSKAEKEAKKVHNVLSFLRTFSRKGVEFVFIRTNTTKSCEPKQYNAEGCTKIGDFIETESVSRRDKGGKASVIKFVNLKHLPKSSARKGRKHGIEFEKVYTFAAQRGAKTTKTPPRPLHFTLKSSKLCPYSVPISPSNPTPTASARADSCAAKWAPRVSASM